MTRPGGEVVVLDAADKVETESTVVAVCDGPRCGVHNGNDQPTTLTWIQETVAADPAVLPDAIARFIKVQFTTFSDKVWEFCGPRCLKDHLDYEYTPPLSPGEMAKKLAAEQKADEAIAAANLPQHDPVSQADGEAVIKEEV